VLVVILFPFLCRVVILNETIEFIIALLQAREVECAHDELVSGFGNGSKDGGFAKLKSELVRMAKTKPPSAATMAIANPPRVDAAVAYFFFCAVKKETPSGCSSSIVATEARAAEPPSTNPITRASPTHSWTSAVDPKGEG
jgi:hypothetical protein